MEINYISSQAASECSYIMITSAVLGNLTLQGLRQ